VVVHCCINYESSYYSLLIGDDDGGEEYDEEEGEYAEVCNFTTHYCYFDLN
jgi:hypothetical protein